MTAELARLSPAGLVPAHELRIDVGGAVVLTNVYFVGDHVVIPIDAKLPPTEDRPRGGYLRGVFEVDRESYDSAHAIAQAHGLTAVRLADIAERVLGHRPLLTIDPRPILAR